MYDVMYILKYLDNFSWSRNNDFIFIYFSGLLWNIHYGIFYNSRLLNAVTWPALNVTQLQTYLPSYSTYRFMHWSNMNWNYWFHLYLNRKVSWLDYGKFEHALELYWTKHYGGKNFMSDPPWEFFKMQVLCAQITSRYDFPYKSHWM